MNAPVARPLDVFTCPLDGIALVEASAGTGKTWNLCGLFLRLLLERRLEVQQVLVVTFTNAATGELRERIRARLVDVLAALDGRPAALADPFVSGLLDALRRPEVGLTDTEMRARVARALQTFDEAAIFTIHGFCQRALADAPFASAMPLRQELGDDAALVREVVFDFWRRHVAGGTLPAGVAELLLSRGDTPDAWVELVRRRSAKPLARLVWPALLDEPVAADTTALERVFEDARRLWRSEREAVLAAVHEALPRLPANRYKPDSVATAARCWDEIAAAPSALLAPSDKLLDKGKAALLGAAKLQPKKGLAPPAPHAFFEAADALLEALAAARAALEVERLRLVRRLLEDAPERLRALKRERRVLAFDDMLQNLHERLTGGACPQLAAALKARFPAALIDEFQDTDPLQWAIFEAVYGAGDAPLFLIGDPKQAIYSFRNADLNTYLAARQRAAASWTLAQNQRSSEPLLAALNGLFGHQPRAFMQDGLDYQPVGYGAKPRAPFADRGAERAALELWSLPRDDQGQPLAKSAAMAAAAAACAAEIARLVDAGRRGDATLAGRGLAAGDVAVLVRSHRQGARMRQALAALGVASVELSQASVFASRDAEDLERLLGAVLEPANAARLRAALATEAMGFDAARIAALADDEAALAELVQRFAAYREAWFTRGVAVMLRRWMQDEGVAARLLSRPDGERRMTNWLHLAECLQRAAETLSSPEALQRWLHDERRAPGGDEEAQLRLESDRNLVQIVTIHKSKGLEYPVVFCPFVFDGHAGGGGSDGEGRELHDTAGQQLWVFGDAEVEPGSDDRAKVEQAAETLRLLYVALTRAVHRLVLVVGPYAVRKSAAESTRALLNWFVADGQQEPAAWLAGKREPEEVDAAWLTFAAAHPQTVTLRTLPDTPGTPVAVQAADPEAIVALPAPAVPPAWWIGSYSSLTQGLRHEGAAQDRDEAQRPARRAAPATLAADDVLRFPRGAVAGECLHALFEHADFADAARWPEAAARALALHPPEAEADSGRLAPMLETLLADVLATRLPGGVVLGDVAPGKRLAELEFTLPSPALAADTLAAVLREAGLPVPALAFGTLRGYLRGFIDLVFEHRGRCHVLDWKSNHLGWTAADYGPEPVAREVAAHGYQLQALLYLVALHRWQRARRAGYDPERHLGGAMVLFVRGVRPGWRNADGSPAGVWAYKPSVALIERLSALFDAVENP
ncbi:MULTISPECIES: exodeoxyribonuclease V subunit beta [unclassified Rubrivivax]|uniref:exodeoxyribonuclease V subunit beta n=1 Tax=unclassified Rubrivivax TaxID=2649762 RepID=UPI001E4D3422|nr:MULTISPECIES: exodeoxyribonuclease V subunit beta [unclassified Rubrivivax]MCC9595239.1 exodeoxyribonuclease V subunit beta [Rubrivivax sp. JA1055]MCC9647968.1 exodeoxyribonuclease V subunit beta [Rubrivivax sp. JA1029]